MSVQVTYTCMYLYVYSVMYDSRDASLTCVSILQEGTNAIVVHFSPFYDILKMHSLAVLRAITEAAAQAEHPLEFLLSKQGINNKY